jgi:hypothetical protein
MFINVCISDEFDSSSGKGNKGVSISKRKLNKVEKKEKEDKKLIKEKKDGKKDNKPTVEKIEKKSTSEGKKKNGKKAKKDQEESEGETDDLNTPSCLESSNSITLSSVLNSVSPLTIKDLLDGVISYDLLYLFVVKSGLLDQNSLSSSNSITPTPTNILLLLPLVFALLHGKGGHTAASASFVDISSYYIGEKRAKGF